MALSTRGDPEIVLSATPPSKTGETSEERIYKKLASDSVNITLSGAEKARSKDKNGDEAPALVNKANAGDKTASCISNTTLSDGEATDGGAMAN